MPNVIRAKVLGLQAAMARAEHVKRLVHVNKRLALEMVLVELVNYAKRFHPFRNQTGALEASIHWRIETIGGEPVGLFIAGEDYAIHVELKEGYWVLSGAVEELKPVLTKVFGEQMQISSTIDVPGRGRSTLMRFAA